jgi:hypothetical protein
MRLHSDKRRIIIYHVVSGSALDRTPLVALGNAAKTNP